MKALVARLCQSARQFLPAREGNIAVIFALSSLPIVGLIGASVDYSRANAVKADLQAALDATALMVSKTAANQSAADLQKSAQAYFEALFRHPEAKSTKITATYNSKGGSSVTVSGTTSVETEFASIMGFDKLDVTSSSTAAWGTSKLQVALVLDNTGSMAASGKMTALKKASHNLLQQLQDAAQKDGDVHVAIVPFAKDVNVGQGSYQADWIDWSDWDDDNGQDTKTTTCASQKKGKNGKLKKKCSTSTTWVPDDHKTWNGCMTDRDQDYDTLNTTPDPSDKNKSGASTLFPAEQYDACPVALMPLTYDWKALNKLVDQMSPDGNTNQMIGLAWGWQALTPGAPLGAPVPDKDTKQVIVLLTDGLNTQNRWTTNQSEIDAREVITCNNIKKAGVTIYAVQVKGNGDPTSKVLQNCATDTSKFFALDSANQIVTAFNTIGTNLSQLRLAK